MSTRAMIENQIRQILNTEKQAITLSRKLFGPGGLFQQLGATEQQRREIIQSDLYREAQKRLTELQKQEAAEFARTAENAQSLLSGTGTIRGEQVSRIL
jgi:hypothetical protein